MHSHFSVNKEWHQYFLEFNTRFSFSCIIEKKKNSISCTNNIVRVNLRIRNGKTIIYKMILV